MLTFVALGSLVYLVAGSVFSMRRRRGGSDLLTPSSVSREWLLQYQTNERPAHY